MSAKIDRLLAEFVNREIEMEQFIELLEDPHQQAYAIWGEGGVGKTYFLQKMLHEVSNRKLNRSEVLITNTRNTDYLAIMRKIRDDLGSEYFSAFTDLVNYFTVPQYELNINIKGGGDISILRDANISDNAQVGDISAVVIKDVMLSDPRADRAVPEEERLTRLTDTFVDCLKNLPTSPFNIIFIDATEKLSERNDRWLWSELIKLVTDQSFRQIKFVVCGRQDPELDRSWRDTASVHQLNRLSLEHIEQYLGKRGITKSVSDIAVVLDVTSDGNMLNLATAVDAIIKKYESIED